MSFTWSREHAALLGALRGEALIPRLYRRLCRERFVASPDELRRLRDWPASLLDAAGWPHLERALDRPEAWPRAWHDAVAAGFPPRADHHHALLFSRFAARFEAADDFEGADFAISEAFGAWARVLGSDYPRRLLDDLAPKTDEVDAEEVVRTLLDATIESLGATLLSAMGLGPGADRLRLHRRRLRYAWRALEAAEDRFGATDPASPHGDDPFGALAHAAERARASRAAATAAAIRRLQEAVADLDLTEAGGDAILAPFTWFVALFDDLGPTTTAAATVVGEAVDVCWKLRKFDRDEIDAFGELLRLVAPYNERLIAALSRPEAFGKNARAADFIVFQAEQEGDHAERERLLERALELCPGHRNSAMLLSYEHLLEANIVLLKLSAIPGLAGKMPGGTSRIEDLVLQAWGCVDRAEQTYAFNDEIDAYRDRVRAEAARLHVDLGE